MQAEQWWTSVTKDTVLSMVSHIDKEELSTFSSTLYNTFSKADAYQSIDGAKQTLKDLQSSEFALILM